MRLANGPSPNQGTVEFFWQGRWSTLCALQGWTPLVASVVCAQLGLPSAAPQLTSWGQFPMSNGTSALSIWWNCLGSEPILQECTSVTMDSWSAQNCDGDNLRGHTAGEALEYPSKEYLSRRRRVTSLFGVSRVRCSVALLGSAWQLSNAVHTDWCLPIDPLYHFPVFRSLLCRCPSPSTTVPSSPASPATFIK